MHYFWKSTFPLGIDDPQKVDTIGELMEDFIQWWQVYNCHADIEPMNKLLPTSICLKR